MKNVKAKASGTLFADVALATGPFSASAVSGAFNLDAGQSHTTGIFRGKAKAATGAAQDIVSARIDSWDANLDHILLDRSGAGSFEGKLNKNIAAN
jgi:hypothetical protein